MRVKSWVTAEKKIARQLNGRRTPGSGNGYYETDILSDAFAVEMKETQAEYITFNVGWLAKVFLEAGRERKTPVFGVEFGNGSNLFLIQKLCVNEDMLTQKVVDWTKIKSQRLYPGDLSRGDVVKTKLTGDWVVVDIFDLKDLQSELMEER